MGQSEYFPRLIIKEKREKHTLEGRETVEEFLARGGSVQRVDSSVMKREQAGRQSKQQVLDRYRQVGHKLSGLK